VAVLFTNEFSASDYSVSSFKKDKSKCCTTWSSSEGTRPDRFQKTRMTP